MWLYTLSFVSGIIYLISKWYLYQEKETGWLLGIAASIFGGTYFFFLGVFTLVWLEIGVVLFLLYKHFASHKISVIVTNYILILVFFGLCCATFLTTTTTTTVELLGSGVFLLAIYFLVRDDWVYAWIAMFIGHLTLAWIGFIKNDIILLFFQCLSFVLAILALMKKREGKSLLCISGDFVIMITSVVDILHHFESLTYGNNNI